MRQTIVHDVGHWTISRIQFWNRIAWLATGCLNALLCLRVLNPAVGRVVIRQIYFTAIQALPIVVFIALVIGSITVHYLLSILTGLGAYDRIGGYLIAAIMHEVAPLGCSLILLLRSGSAVIAEVALMKINKELNSLQMLDIDIDSYIFLPRLLAFALSAVTLTFCFTLTALLGGFFILGYFHDITFANYLDRIVDALHIESFLIATTKPLLMGACVGLVAMEKGMRVERSFSEVPIRLIHGMMQGMAFIVAIEVFFVLVTS
ncbi:MAG: ABC transporter permease [Deltaproteobacteria bacterium]|nr:ABC transporter permease [Deltaproteobacteria bacterium]